MKHKFIQPEESRLRLSQADLRQIDEIARKQGRPKPWRLTGRAREASRKETLAGRMDQDLWVLAYGSLIWDPCINMTELRRARVTGHRRHFCLTQTFDRGSPEHPGLMLALDSGNTEAYCDAFVMRIPADQIDTETTYLWRREMFAGTYIPTFLTSETPQGEVESLVFVVDHDNPRCVDLPLADAARQIASASGSAGTNVEYLENLVADLESVGLRDPQTEKLLDMVYAVGDMTA